MDIRLIAVDLDGTLLNSQKELTPRTKEALTRAAEKGVHIVPATGRTFGGVPEIVRSLPFVRYGICINGGSVWDAQIDGAIHTAEIPYERAEEIFDYVEQFHTMYDCYVDGWGKSDRKFFDHLLDYVDEDVVKIIKATRSPVDDFRGYIRSLSHDIQKIILFFRDLEVHDRMIEKIRADLPDMAVTAALPCNIELNNKDANKGAALRILCEHLGFGPEQAMAFGDGGNDQSMIETAGLGVVMANGVPELKAAADYITLSNDEDGVAAAIEKFVLNV
mgnify:CR=1 FL=1